MGQNVIVHTLSFIPKPALCHLKLSLNNYCQMVVYAIDMTLINGEDISAGTMFEHELVAWMSAQIGQTTNWSSLDFDAFNMLAQNILSEVRTMIDESDCHSFMGGIECVGVDTNSIYVIGRKNG